jgi:hypothetical protein
MRKRKFLVAAVAVATAFTAFANHDGRSVGLGNHLVHGG